MSVRTFRGLFLDENRVVIPMIQRDYAQGRDDHRSQSILAAFLDEIHRVLVDSATAPLDLDFVYGRWHEDTGVLEPLDGQQRLTSLFLLHWYLAQRDGCQADLRSWLEVRGHCAFSYRTRPSAEEFIDALVAEEVAPSLLTSFKRLSSWIADRTWFLRAWQRDPTVSGCLAALDAIHHRFQGLEGGYQRLIDEDHPRITFHLLHLRDFQLSDDLYVKMNARGKPLTSFEVFKAELQQHTEEVFGDEKYPGEARTWAQYLSDRIDREWTDFLWRHRDKQTHEIDARFVQLVKAIAMVHCALEENPDDEVLDGQVEQLLQERDPNLNFYSEIGCLGRSFMQRLVRLLDVLSESPGGELGFIGRSDYFDERAAFESLLNPDGRFGINLPDWAKFSAYGMFLLTRADGLGDQAAQTAFHDWMRLVCNLVDNSDVDRIERLVVSLRSIARMHEVGASDDLLQRVVDDEDLARGFNRDQRVEERVKARLILADPSWRALIERAETHSYFRGDLQFLLRWSGAWSLREDDAETADHPALQSAFETWYTRACAMFPADRRGLAAAGSPAQHLWERALLTRGNYLLRRGQNFSLLDDLDRDASWKRLLRADTKLDDRERRRDIARSVFERIEPADPEASLRAVIAEGPEDGSEAWRRVLASDGRIIQNCRKRMLRFESGTVYLLATTQLNGYYVDLFTFGLFLKVKDRWDAGELAGFEKPHHPWVRGSLDRCQLVLARSDGTGSIEVTTEQMKSVLRLQIGERWIEAVEANGYEATDSSWQRTVDLGEVEDAFFDTVAFLTDETDAGDE